MNLRVPWNAGNFLTSCKSVSCSRRTLHHGVSKYVSNVTLQVGSRVSCCKTPFGLGDATDPEQADGLQTLGREAWLLRHDINVGQINVEPTPCTNRLLSLRSAYSGPSKTLRTCRQGARGGAAGSDNALQTIRLRFRFPMLLLGFFIDIIFQAATMGLGSTQPVTDKSTRRRGVGLTTLPPSCADCHEIWELQPPGTLRVCPGLYRDCFTSFKRRHRFQRSFAVFSKIAKSGNLRHLCLSVRPFACSAPTGWIFMKFDILGFF